MEDLGNNLRGPKESMSSRSLLALACLFGYCLFAQDSTTTRYAVLVGAEMDNLKGPATDVCSAARALTSLGNFRRENVRLISTESCEGLVAVRPTVERMRAVIRAISAQMKDGDLLFLLFSGHGESRGDQYFLLPSTSAGEKFEDALEFSSLLNLLAEGNQRRDLIIALDACRADFYGQLSPEQKHRLSASLDAQVELFGKRFPQIQGRVLFASQAGEVSYSRARNPVGYFTWALLKGIAGEAADEDGRVRLSHLAAFIENEVPNLLKFDLASAVDPLRDTVKYKQLPHTVKLGKGADALEVSRVAIGCNFVYSGEVVMMNKDSEGLGTGFELRVDFVSRRAGLNETLPFKPLVHESLDPILIPHEGIPIGEKLDYYVRIAFHIKRYHRAFILCNKHPALNGVEVSLVNQTLKINATRAFAGWRNVMGDVCDGDSEELVQPGYWTESMCEGLL
jgi:hypothetical protein